MGRDLGVRGLLVHLCYFFQDKAKGCLLPGSPLFPAVLPLWQQDHELLLLRSWPSSSSLRASTPAQKCQSLTRSNPVASDELQELCLLMWEYRGRLKGKLNPAQGIVMASSLTTETCICQSAPLRLLKCSALETHEGRVVENAFKVHHVSVPLTGLFCISFLLLISQDCCVTSINKIYPKKDVKTMYNSTWWLWVEAVGLVSVVMWCFPCFALLASLSFTLGIC